MFLYYGPPHRIVKSMLFHLRIDKEGYKDQWENIHLTSGNFTTVCRVGPIFLQNSRV